MYVKLLVNKKIFLFFYKQFYRCNYDYGKVFQVLVKLFVFRSIEKKWIEDELVSIL